MRKYILIGICIFLALVCLLRVSVGKKSYGNIKKAFYSNIELKDELDKKNGDEYKSAQEKLDATVKNYKSNQEQYNALSSSSESSSAKKGLDKAKLKTTLEKYAKQNLLNASYEIKKSSEIISVSDEFAYYDIYFSVIGEYYDIDKFIETIENDFSLGFTVENFEMKNSENGIEAKFIVKNIAINEAE